MKNNKRRNAGFVVLLALPLLMLSSLASLAETQKKPAKFLDQVHAENDVSCIDCHDPAQKREAVGMLTCLECHDTEEVADATADNPYSNPHRNDHYGTEADCNLCHHQHQVSENYCTPCHLRFEYEVP